MHLFGAIMSSSSFFSNVGARVVLTMDLTKVRMRFSVCLVLNIVLNKLELIY